jgi:hypothetical protein
MVRRPAWLVYFRGIPVELIPEAVAQAEKRGADFASPRDAAPTLSEITASPAPLPPPPDSSRG